MARILTNTDYHVMLIRALKRKCGHLFQYLSLEWSIHFWQTKNTHPLRCCNFGQMTLCSKIRARISFLCAEKKWQTKRFIAFCDWNSLDDDGFRSVQHSLINKLQLICFMLCTGEHTNRCVGRNVWKPRIGWRWCVMMVIIACLKWD